MENDFFFLGPTMFKMVSYLKHESVNFFPYVIITQSSTFFTHFQQKIQKGSSLFDSYFFEAIKYS